MPTCVIKGCRNRPELVQQKKTLTITFHRFPILNQKMMKVWMKSIGTHNLKNPTSPIHKSSIICSEHFEPIHFKYSGMRTRISATAVPTIFSVSYNPTMVPSSSPAPRTSEMEQDTGLAAIEDIKNIANVQIPIFNAPSKKTVEIPSIPLLIKEEPQPLRKILPAKDSHKKTFVFLRNVDGTYSREQPHIPAVEMLPSTSSKISVTNKPSHSKLSVPFEIGESSANIKQEVVCVVGLGTRLEPDVRVFESSALEGIRKFEHLCRVCLNTTEYMTSIFEHQLETSALADKIHKHLSIQVSIDDKLPLKLCSNCVQMLNSIDELSAKSYESELQLKLILDMDTEAISSGSAIEPSENLVKPKIDLDNESKTYTCPDCGKHIKTYKSYARHCYSVHKKKKCKWCETLLSNQEEINKHRIEVHGTSCAACGIKFQGINAMLRHVRLEHPDFKSNTCEICGKSFVTKYSLAVHYEVHNSSNPYLCDACGKNFNSRQKLKHHRCSAKGDEQNEHNFECPHCGKRYTFRSSLLRHMQRHTGNKNFQCHVCCKRFYGSVNLKNHMVVHERSTIYECQMCCARYYHKRNMITHLKEKHSTRWHYKCPYCVHLFPTIDDVIKHRDETHECHLEVKKDLVEVEREPGTYEEFRCKICEQQFENIYALTHHFEEHVIHGPEDLNIKTIGVDGLLECALCGANLTSTWAMRCHIKKMHLTLHQKMLMHTCDHCSKQFATKSQLRRHIMQHTGEKPFHCATCNSGFRSRNAHKIHMRIHTGETPFHCPKCPKKFRSSAILRNHEGVHMRPFSCNLCLQRFSSKSALKSHMDLHERGSLPGYKCQFCDFVSKNRSAVKKHEVLSHVEIDANESTELHNVPQLVSDMQHGQDMHQSEFNSTVEATYFTI